MSPSSPFPPFLYRNRSLLSVRLSVVIFPEEEEEFVCDFPIEEAMRYDCERDGVSEEPRRKKYKFIVTATWIPLKNDAFSFVVKLLLEVFLLGIRFNAHVFFPRTLEKHFLKAFAFEAFRDFS